MSGKMKQDARYVISMRRKQKAAANIATAKRLDARQIIKQKQRFKSRQNVKSSYVPQANLVRKQFGQVFSQQQQINRRNFNNDNMRIKTEGRNVRQNQNGFSPRRAFQRVQVDEAGILKVTSRARSVRPSETVIVPQNKYVTSNVRGITVTTRNPSLQRGSGGEPMEEGDELEKMTLGDLPDIQDIKTFPRGLVPSKKLASSTSSVFGHLRDDVNTMVADTIQNPSSQRQTTWKVCITNLEPTVSEEDISELFGHIAAMKSCRMMKSGTAIVEYYTKQDAVNACDTYHSRLLDGQPMQCVVAEIGQSRTPITSRLGGKYLSNQVAASPPSFSRQSTSSGLAFSRVGSGILQARKVDFTVKLP